MTCGCLLLKNQELNEKVDFNSFNYSSLNGTMESYPYQKEGVNFIFEDPYSGKVRERSRVLIGDETGLGKTIQALLALRENKEKLLPALICVKSTTLIQWLGEIKKWFGSSFNAVQPIIGSNTLILPGFELYIISMDSLRLFVDLPTEENGLEEPQLKEKFKKDIDGIGGFKTIVFDECHSIKDASSSRTRALLTLLNVAGPPTAPVGTESSLSPSQSQNAVGSPGAPPFGDNKSTKLVFNKQTNHYVSVEIKDIPKKNEIPNVIMMSATAIKNTAGEYFNALNILEPSLFHSKYKFEYEWLDYGGKFLKSYRQKEFHELTKSFIIRRRKEEVLPDLPKLRRDFTWITISDERIKKLYNLELNKLKIAVAEGSRTSMQVSLMTMRRIIGVAKAMFAADVISSDPESLPAKYTIGIHHYDASSVLFKTLEPLKPLIFDGQSKNRHEILAEFENNPLRKILILSMGAGGVGLNLQFCSEALGVERMWSAADESQFEGRFVRIGSKAETHVRVEYYVVKKTIDEFFHGLVEEKRAIFGSTIDGEDPLEDGAMVKRAAEWALENRL